MARTWTGESARRLFAVYAAASLVPVLALAALLFVSLHRNNDEDGLAEARATSALLARSVVAPQLTGGLRNGLTQAESHRLARAVQDAIAGGAVSRLRVRSLDGRVVYSDDGSGLGRHPVEDEVRDAAHGEVVAQLTRLNDDEGDVGPAGPRVVEIYRPLLSTTSRTQIGVLELYVPYAPIARHIAAQRRGIVIVLSFGLGALWLILLIISASVTRRLRRQLDRTRHLARHDQLTGLPNRTSFAETVADELTRHRGLAVAVLDLDGFRQVNEVLGHHNGDALLIELGDRLREATGDAGRLARLGSDEFGVVFPADADADDDADGVGRRLGELRQAVAEPVIIDGIPLVVPVTVGYAVSPHDGETVDSLVRHADLAVRTAKQHQLDVLRYRPEQERYDAAALALIGELARAISGDELVLHYQPKGDLGDGTIREVEALVRWQHPERGLLFPDAFIPLAERTELVDDLLRWVVRRAARDLRDLDDVAVAVNMSARSVSRPDTAEMLLATLAEVGMPPHRVIVEITETAVMADPFATELTLGRLHDAGARISIDDFGAGQTSLGYLATLPVSEVKVDKTFVLAMTDNPRQAAIVRSVIDLGHGLGCHVTAEGVETQAVLDDLRALRCDTAQGYLLARPVPRDALVAAISGARASLGAATVAV